MKINCALLTAAFVFCLFDASHATSGLNVGADWLYLKVSQDNLRAGTFLDDFPNPVLKQVDGTAVEPGFKYSNGYRVNVGYEFPCDLWELNATYTYIPINSTSDCGQTTISTPDHNQFIAANAGSIPFFNIFQSPTGFVQMTSLFTKWHGNLSYVDADLARTLTFCSGFHVRPHLGFRAAWMTQKYVAEGNLQIPTFNGAQFVSMQFSEQFQGYGLEGGLWTDWDVGCGFSLVGHVGGSILYATFKIQEKAKGSLTQGQDPVFIFSQNPTIHTATPTLEYLAGLQYAMTYCDVVIAAHIAWEQRVFFDLNQISSYGGNFSAQGLNFGVDVGF